MFSIPTPISVTFSTASNCALPPVQHHVPLSGIEVEFLTSHFSQGLRANSSFLQPQNHSWVPRLQDKQATDEGGISRGQVDHSASGIFLGISLLSICFPQKFWAVSWILLYNLWVFFMTMVCNTHFLGCKYFPQSQLECNEHDFCYLLSQDSITSLGLHWSANLPGPILTLQK